MPNYLESVDSEWFNQRLVRVLVFVLAACALLMIRLVYLQVIGGKEYRRLSEINSIRLQDIDAPRGLIFDRNGHMLVDNRPSFDLSIILKDAKPLTETLEKLGRLINEPVETLSASIKSSKKRSGYTPILLKEDIGRDLLAAVEVHKYDLPGVVVHVSPKRHYLFGKYAAHLIGYVGEINLEELGSTLCPDCKAGDFIGKFGIEKADEELLRGKRGGQQVEVNATGQIVRIIETVDAEPGQNITLTIDQALQEATEQLLQGQAGAAVAVDPDSGEILAMASSPSFDPNLFTVGMSHDEWNALISNPARPLENKVIQAEYPPASTFKIVTAMAGLEEGVIDVNTTFFCPGFYRYGNRVYRCWRHAGHGEVNVVQALAQSCDVFFYQVGEALGIDRLAWYAKASGLGSTTGINLDREGRGLIPTAAWKRKRMGVSWQGGETLSVAIGQGFDLVTPLQMAMLIAAVGNGGTRYRPQLIKRRESAENKIVFESKPVVVGQLPIHAENLALVREGLFDVVNELKGTAHRSKIQGLEFSGKTGTAQVVGRKPEGDEPDAEQLKALKDHAWFVAYAPSEKPSIAVAVLIEHGEHGSSAAAPVAREMIRNYLHLPEDQMSAEIRAAIKEAAQNEQPDQPAAEGD